MPSDTFEKEMLACLPALKTFAISLCGNAVRAEDLVQETMLRALGARSSFTLGSNMPAWLFTILRNYFRSEYRKYRREVEDADGFYWKKLRTLPNQVHTVYLAQCIEALNQLPDEKRKAVEYIVLANLTYEEAAKTLDCAVGTVKSRLNRAREALADFISYENDSRVVLRGNTRPPGMRRFYKETQASRPPAVALPVKRYVRGSREWNAISREALQKAKARTAQPQSVAPLAPSEANASFCGIRFVLERTILLPDGRTQRIYKAA